MAKSDYNLDGNSGAGSIGRDSVYNLLGTAVPLALFIVSIPAYILLIGASRYGVLAIVWLVLGTFGMLDLGLGRATTQKIASLRGDMAKNRRAALDAALTANLAIALFAALSMASVAWFIFSKGMKLEPWLRAEALPLIPLMAAGVPVVTTVGILSGALQGRERFLVTNRINITSSALFQLIPLTVAWVLGPTLWPLVLSALCVRLLTLALLWIECRREFGSGRLQWRRGETLTMLRYGGWVTVAGLVGTALVYTDRLAIGASMGAAAVAVYSIPLDATRRLAVIADALANAIFPRLAIADANQTRRITGTAMAMIYLFATPSVGAIIMTADPLFRLWLGSEIGAQSANFAQILAVAAWVNMFAKPAYARLQAQGKPKVVALSMLAQLPFYCAALWWALTTFGLWGAACVYLARNTADTVLLNVFAGGQLGNKSILAATFVVLLCTIPAAHRLSAFGATTLFVSGVGLAAVGTVAGWLNLPAELRSRLSVSRMLRRWSISRAE